MSPDGAPPDGIVPDASIGALPDAGPVGYALTVRTFPNGFPSATGITENATLLALQDGDGPWTALTGTNGVYHATITNQRYGIAVGCTAPSTSLTFFYQTVADATDALLSGCFDPPDPAKTASVVVNVHSARDPVILTVGGNSTSARMTNGSGSATITTEQEIADVFALNFDFTTGPDFIPKVATYRGPALDLAGTHSMAMSIDMAVLAHPLEEHPFTVVDAPVDGAVDQEASVASGYFTLHSSVPQILITQFISAGAVVPTAYGTVDAASRQPGDMVYINPRSTGTTASGRSYQRDVFLESTNPGELTARLPDLELADVVPTIDFTTAVPRGTVVFPNAPPMLGYRSYQANLTTTNGTDSRLLGIAVSPAWAQGQTSISVTPPDLSQLPSWTPDMELLPGLPVDWTTFLDDRNMPYGVPLADGKQILVTQVFGKIQPPAPAGKAAARKARARLAPTRLAPKVGSSARQQRIDRAPRITR